jgi:hypothetical protein
VVTYIWTLRRTATGVTITADGLAFTGTDLVVPWNELRWIRRLSSNLPRLRWGYDGGHVDTWLPLERQESLILEVQRHAPNLRSTP